MFDRNGDGYISKSEFKHCMMHFGERFTDDEVEEMISEADSNNDGKIDYAEFSHMILKELNMEAAANAGVSALNGLPVQNNPKGASTSSSSSSSTAKISNKL